MDMVRVRVASYLVFCLVHEGYSITNILMLKVMHHCCIVSYQRALYISGVNEVISFQKLVGNLDKMAVANLGRQHRNL